MYLPDVTYFMIRMVPWLCGSYTILFRKTPGKKTVTICHHHCTKKKCYFQEEVVEIYIFLLYVFLYRKKKQLLTLGENVFTGILHVYCDLPRCIYHLTLLEVKYFTTSLERNRWRLQKKKKCKVGVNLWVGRNLGNETSFHVNR